VVEPAGDLVSVPASSSSTDALLAPSDLGFEPSRDPEHVTRGDLKAHFLCIKDIGCFHGKHQISQYPLTTKTVGFEKPKEFDCAAELIELGHPVSSSSVVEPAGEPVWMYTLLNANAS